MAVFFVSLLPPFAGASPSFFELLALGLLFALMTLIWLAGYAGLVAKVGDLLRRGRIRRLLDGLTGVVLVAVGLRLAAEKP
jgi:threonine/homoserine/homoserine lactone efflux protein